MAATKRKNINPRIERKITRISGVREVKQTSQLYTLLYQALYIITACSKVYSYVDYL